MLKSVRAGQQSTNNYFEQICECELRIDQINTEISQLEEEREHVSNQLDIAYMIYSNLNTKGM